MVVAGPNLVRQHLEMSELCNHWEDIFVQYSDALSSIPDDATVKIHRLRIAGSVQPT